MVKFGRIGNILFKVWLFSRIIWGFFKIGMFGFYVNNVSKVGFW